MRIATSFGTSRASTTATLFLLSWLATSPARVIAQTGYNVVTSGVGTLPASTFASTSFIDASAYAGPGIGHDICTTIFLVFTHTPPRCTPRRVRSLMRVE
jgi:hypothetical protein